MFQADDLQPGDIVVFSGGDGIDEELADIMGLIVKIETVPSCLIVSSIGPELDPAIVESCMSLSSMRWAPI